MKTAMQQQQQKPKQLTLFQAGFKKDEISRWGVPIGPGPSHSAPPPPQPGPSCSAAVPPGLPPQASDQQGSDVILIDDDDDDLLLAQALDQTMSEYLDTAPPLAAAAGTPLEVLPGFDAEAGTTWVYPVNYPVRQYQYNIVHTAIFENTLVSLPTGLGKTFIAAVLMYNFYRWYPRGKVVFLAPTRPLVAQQIDACYRIMGISREDTAELTGSMAPSDRRSRWLDRRVFFLTPQVLNNDLTTGSCPAELLRCVVIDEAHKALGNHAYCQVVRELSRHTSQFRVLALSATPGSDLKAVIQVLTNLLISRVEVRSEESPDVTPYTHGRQLEKIVVPLGDGLKAVRDKYMQVVRTFVSRLIQLKVVYTRDETTLTKFALLRARDAFKQSPPPGLAAHQQGLVESDFAMCMSLYHALELLQLHGVRSFHTFVQSIVRGEKGSARGRAELVRNPVFNELLTELEQKFGLRPDDGSTVGADGEQVAAPAALEQSHPKLARLRELVEQHFRDCGDTTRVMVFSQYRESVLEISAVLQQLHPTVRAMHFIGQSAGKSSRGFSQKEQLKVIAAFRTGGFNTLVSTCVGEEGLDIGDVDLIVCYDVSKSPISLVQRMGRTGRKRQGRIVVLVTEGKEDHVYNQSMYQRKSILKTIMTGTKLGPHLFKNSPRMIPRGLQPVCHRLHMTVAASSPATATGRGRARGRGRGGPVAGRGRGRGRGAGRVAGGGQMASLLAALAPERGPATAAYLTDEEMREWDARYKLRPGDEPARRLPPRHATGGTSSAVRPPDSPVLSLTEWLPWQTTLQPTHAVSHSAVSRNLVRLLAFMAEQAHTGADGYDQEMTALRRHAGVELEPSPPAPAMPPPPVPARPASPPVRPAADLSALSESEQVAEAIRLSLLETSGADSPPPPPPPPPDWPPVAPPPLFTGWGGAAGLLSALEEALAAPLVTVDEGALMMSAERTERLEARCWLEAERHGSERKDPTAGRDTGDLEEEWKFVNEESGTAGPEVDGRTNAHSDVTKPESALGAAVPSEPPKPVPVCEADALEGPSDAPEGGAAGWDDLPDDWNADWEWNPSPLPPATPPPSSPLPPPSSPLPPPPSDAPGSSVPPRPVGVHPSRPPVVSLLSEEDGSPILPSQNPSKRRKLSRGSKRRKIELPSVETVLGGALENGRPTAEPIGTTGWGNTELPEEGQTRPSPPAATISSPVSRLQAGLTRRPSSEDLFADESLFARVEEPPASAGEPAASLGFEPAPALATPASASAPPSAVAEDGSGTAVERQSALDLQPDRDRLQRESKPADVVAGGRNRLESTGNALKSKTSSRELFSGKQPKSIIPAEKEETHSVNNSEPPPAPTATTRRRHPSSQPLFDFGLDDDALFANVVTPPPAPEPQPPSPDRPPPAPAVPAPVVSVLPAVSVAVCSPLRSPPLLARSALSVRDSPAAGSSIYSTTQLLELVDKSVMSPGGRTPSGKGPGRMGEKIGTPVGRVRGERQREKDIVAEKTERVRVESERGENGKTGGTATKPAPAASAAREVEKPVFDLFADFFEDSDLFEGVTSNPGGAADAADHKELPEAKDPVKPADSVEVVDLSDSHDVTVVEQGGTVDPASKPAPSPEALPVTGTPSTNLTIRGPTAATPDSPLFTVTRPRPQTPSGDPAAPGGGAVTSPAVSPILSSQRRVREAVDRRHSTPLSARGRRRLSKAKQRHSSTGVTPAGPAGRPAGLVAGLGDEDLWAEDEFDTCRRPAPRVLRMDGTAPRVPVSPLAGRHVTWGPETHNRHTTETESYQRSRNTNGTDASDNTLVQSTSAGASRSDKQPVVLLSRISDAVSPLARPSRPKSGVSDQESPLIPSRLAANETDSPVIPARAAPNNTESPLIPAGSAANVTDSPVARVVGRRRHRPAFLRDSEEETPPVGWVTEFGEEGGPGGDRQEARSRQESRSRVESARDSSSESVGRRPAAAAGKKRRRRRRARNPFLDDEADLSTDASAASSDDESDGPDSDQYDESMIDDAPDPTQPDVDMRAVYLKSVRSPGRAAPAFRRPALPRPSDSELFSQVPHQDDDYEQDSFCVDSDHVEYVSSASSHGESPAKRQRGRRRRIRAVSSSEGERSPVGRRDASATVRSDTSATVRSDAGKTNRPPSGSESDVDFQLDGTEAIPRSVERKRVTKKSSDEKTNISSSTNGVWLSSKRPAGSILKSSTKAKRRSDPDDPFETPTFGTSKKRTSRNMDRPVFDLGLFDSDEEMPTVAPLSERKENIVPDSAERARQARLERARQKQAEFRERLSMRRTPQTAGSAGGGGVEVAGGGGSAGPSGVQSRPPVPSAGSGRQTATGPSAEQPAPGPLVIIASSREVSCAPRLLSDLRAVHRARTEVRSLPAEDYIVSRRAAVVRRPAADLQTAPGRRRLVARLQRLCRLYSRCWLLVERDRVKAGTAPPPERRPRATDQLIAQLTRAGVTVLHTDSPDQSASVLSRLAAAERQAGWCLPPPPEAPPAPIEDARRRFLEALPAVSVPLAGDIRAEFGTLAQFLQSSPTELERRLAGVTSHGRAAELCQALRWSFSQQ